MDDEQSPVAVVVLPYTAGLCAAAGLLEHYLDPSKVAGMMPDWVAKGVTTVIEGLRDGLDPQCCPLCRVLAAQVSAYEACAGALAPLAFSHEGAVGTVGRLLLQTLHTTLSEAAGLHVRTDADAARRLQHIAAVKRANGDLPS